MKRKFLRSICLVLLLCMLCPFAASCNASPEEPEKNEDTTPDTTQESEALKNDTTDTESDTQATEPDPYITYQADVTWDGIKDKVVVDPVAAADASAEHKTIWVIDGLTDEEIWSTTIGAGNPKKGGAYLKHNTQNGTSHIYFWETYMSDETTLLVRGYHVFSKNDEGKVVFSPMNGTSGEIDISSDRSIDRGLPNFSHAISGVYGGIMSYDNSIALIDTSGEKLMYSTPDATVTVNRITFDPEKGIVFGTFNQN